MANNINNLSGKVNIPTKVATYTGLDTDTAEVIVDNVNKTIAVNVDLSDISSQFISQSKLYREIEARESGDTFLGEQLNTLSNNLETEILTRRSADEEVQKDLQKEIKRASNKEAAIESSLSSTAAAIRGELQAEAQRAEREEGILQSNITAEANAREGADSTLQSNIDTVSGAVEDLDNSLATVAKTGDYRDLSNKPNLSDMATKTWVGEQGFLTSSDISNMVTTDGDQDIVGDKHFTGHFYAQDSGGDYYISITNDSVYMGGYVEVRGTLYATESLDTATLIAPIIKAPRSNYGLAVPNSSSWTANKTIATTDQIPDDSNLVHKTGNETIDGDKAFIGDVYTDKITIDGRALFNANVILDGVTINENQDGYGLRLPDTSDYADNHTIATIDDIPDESTFVHTTGEEFIAGAKHFTNGIWFSQQGLAKLDQSSTNNNELVWSTATTSAKFTIRGSASNGLTISEDGKIIGTKATVETGFDAYLQLPSAGTSSTYATLATTDDIPDDTNLVHKTGDEEILGDKTFGSSSSGTTTTFYGNMASPDVIDSTGVHFGADGFGKRPIDAASLTAYTGENYLGQNKTLYNSNGITYYYREYVDGTPVETSYKLDFPNKKAGTIALDSNVVHKTDDETIEGDKTFLGRIIVQDPDADRGIKYTNNYIQYYDYDNTFKEIYYSLPHTDKTTGDYVLATTDDCGTKLYKHELNAGPAQVIIVNNSSEKITLNQLVNVINSPSTLKAKCPDNLDFIYLAEAAGPLVILTGFKGTTNTTYSVSVINSDTVTAL